MGKIVIESMLTLKINNGVEVVFEADFEDILGKMEGLEMRGLNRADGIRLKIPEGNLFGIPLVN